MSTLVETSKVILSDQELLVCSAHTVYVQKRNIKPLDIPALLKQRDSIVRKIKSLDGIKVKFNSGMKKKLGEYRHSYLECIAKYRDLFSRLKDGWERKMVDGIYTPTCDDVALGELTKLSWKLEPLRYRDSVISKVEEIKIRLDKIQRELENYTPDENREITIFL